MKSATYILKGHKMYLIFLLITQMISNGQNYILSFYKSQISILRSVLVSVEFLKVDSSHWELCLDTTSCS